MTQKEKAKELVEKYMTYIPMQEYEAKQCALIAVDEILDSCIRDIAHLHYWVEVKTEIENI